MCLDKLQAIKKAGAVPTFLSIRFISSRFFQGAFFQGDSQMLLFETDLDEGVTPLR